MQISTGADGVPRCGWCTATPVYVAYHDDEWGRPVHGEAPLFEHLALETFQAGLSWSTILHKRDAFRSAFDDFDPETVAGYDDTDVARLLGTEGIVRNRAKIEATIGNARLVVALAGDLDALLWSYAPTGARPRPHSTSQVPARTPESTAMARELKRRGFRFIGPVGAYALMQSTGMVDDHLVGCHRAVDG
ncbi:MULTISPECIES: DNA-3-methyladenine glycosylase I [unclassified Micromonospora]|uniref:DNA-3-methyladenine glycosylase I n=1 Tax=unclassified Micromonospora TaxID=2617518 RepID=UPI001C5E8A31|nr:DNA-3-methyladenine glycosylase I [Micromonospora sp. RL09-050-HVF-A]MBW4701814.1 DNA-3-methyladenine glycosylase I [Micromonospora sp. RL09-050-HVF-A]